MEPMKPMKPMDRWWPDELGAPSTAGSQNDMRYAFFGDARRLVIEKDGRQVTYNTGEHQITGAAQGGGSDGLVFETRDGPLDLRQLAKL